MTELGCCAGVAAVALATTLLTQTGSGTALVVSVELSTLGMQIAEPSTTDMFANLLFGDGAAAAVLSAERSPRGVEIIASQSVLWPDAIDHLGMTLTNTGFRLVLSPELPKAVHLQLGPTVAQFLAANRVPQDDVGFWIVHPGGPKILEAVGASLNLSDRALQPSWDTWAEFGNLSSANVFFVLRHLQRVAPPRAGQLGVMLALGPGVTCEMVLLRADGWLLQ
jgi:alkylresorcinol/alkylpyrone synthase